MKIGYPCINSSVGCTTNRTFRLASYSTERLIAAVNSNLACLRTILEYNHAHGFLFFRISSDIIPFASHPVCDFPWDEYFRPQLLSLGRLIKKYGMRVSMHPDQFVVLNSPDAGVVQRSVAELEYHCRLLDTMGVPASAKVQVHGGGVYGEKEAAMARFVAAFRTLSPAIRKRLAVEHDERLYSLKDCLVIAQQIPIPVVFDVFHHACFNNNESVVEALHAVCKTWGKKDGVPIVHYSSQQKGAVKGKHAASIDMNDFRRFIRAIRGRDVDIMLEIKDKEKSAASALGYLNRIRNARQDSRR